MNGAAKQGPGWALVHFLWFLVGMSVMVTVTVTTYGIVGVLLTIPLLRMTGRRAGDAWALFIPLYGAALMILTVWRSTAGFVYWSPRFELGSRPLFWYGPATAPSDRHSLKRIVPEPGETVLFIQRVRLDDGNRIPRGVRAPVLATGNADGEAVVSVEYGGEPHWVALSAVE